MKKINIKSIIIGFVISTLLFGITSYVFAETPSNTLVSKIYQTVTGDIFKVFDNDKNLVAKLGSPIVNGDNIGGTLVLYNNSISKQRVEASTWKAYDAGFTQVRDTNSVIRAGIYANSSIGPYVGVTDSSWVLKSYLAETVGYVNNEQIATQKWIDDNYVKKSDVQKIVEEAIIKYESNR